MFEMRTISLLLCSVVLANLIGTTVSRAQCDAGWTLGNHTYMYCYRVSSVRMTYANADSECRKFDASLLRIYTQPTWQDVQTITNTTPTTRWWVGLNDQGVVGDWVYGTGANKVIPDMTMVHFLSEPDDTNHQENCGALNYEGSISDERCADKHRYICQYTPPTGKPCQQSWANYSTECYLFPFGPLDPFSMLTWSAAKQKCQGILAGTSDSNIQAHLLFIQTQDQLNYVRNVLPQITMTSEIWWIGLTDAAAEGQFTWTDGTPVNNHLVVWAVEPNNLGGVERCGYINRAGFYGDLNCGSQESYICQKETPDNNDFPALGCPGSWMRAGKSCYLLEYTNKKSWQDASTACHQSGASLLSVDDPDEKMWLESQEFQFQNGFTFWTGLNNLGSSQWRWSDGSPANMSLIAWNTEPNNFKGNEDCGTLNRLGFINDMSCLSKHGFICEMTQEDQACSAGWVSYNEQDQTNCYYISNSTATVDEAHSKCNQLAFPGNAYLAAFNSKQELTFLQQQIAAQPASDIYEWFTGLTDRGHEGFWTYDTSFNPAPADSLLPWGKWPAYKDGSEHCVAIMLGAQYLNMKCTNKFSYICEKLSSGVSSRGSRIVHTKFSASSVLVVIMYFIVYGICLHYILHLTYVLSPSYAYL